MSLILEALRKSEAERRRGEAPNVYAELPPSSGIRQTTMPTWSWWLLAAALLLVGLWIARNVISRESTPAPAPARAIVDHAPPQDALPPIPRLSPPPSPVPVATVVSKPVDTPAQNMPLPQVPVETAQVASAPRTPAPIPAIGVPAEDNGTVQLSDLSVEERKALPALKLSMHLWNDAPAQRFVIIDGNRLREGDRIGDAVVTAITTDGVVLDWNGRRLKLPIR